MQLAEILNGLDQLIPFRYAEAWDKVGLHIGNPASNIERVQIALDLTTESIAAAKNFQADLLLLHHPPIFAPLSGLRYDQPVERPILEAVKANLAVAALHTNLDAAPGGVADQFAELIGLDDVITFAPLADEKNNILSEPLFDSKKESPLVNIWKNKYSVSPGFGRTGLLPQALNLTALMQLLREQLGSGYLMLAEGDINTVQRITVCPGSYDTAWTTLLREQGSEVLIVGEIKYHDRLLVTAEGISVITVGHDVSERVVLQPLADLCAACWPQLAFAVDNGIDYTKMAF
ncbi:MAG: Nif3-like dinuclear metal center hexameric protein [Ruminococcaceae bacterium]|nr:Nif3-like dinuclear metal center hexameric protein [Oscillospiraceae bacterium]